MWFGVRNKELLIQQVSESLLDRDSVTNYTVVVPPGFGETHVPAKLASVLRTSDTKLSCAFLNCDRVGTKAEFLCELYTQWTGDSQKQHFSSLTDVLASCRKRASRLILVMSRFHKILECLDSSVLTDLRDAEQAMDLRTVVCCIYPLSWIKREWRQRGHVLLSSDYGDVHTQYQCEAIDAAEIHQTFRAYNSVEIPAAFLSKAIAWTGGIPDYLTAVVDLWVRQGQPTLVDAVESQLFRSTVEKAASISRQLDETNESRFLELLVDLWLAPGDHTALRRFQTHPWAHFLVRDGELTSEAVGESCYNKKTQALVTSDSIVDLVGDRLRFVQDSYHRGQFLQAHDTIEMLPMRNLTPEARLLRVHCKIMAAFSETGVDADWSCAQSGLAEALRTIEDVDVRPDDKVRLRDRYAELGDLCDVISHKQANLRGSRRIVDSLARDHTGYDAALAVLHLSAENAALSRGNTEAVTKMLVLPEQIFRVWSLWKLNIDYDSVPSGFESSWSTAGQEWELLRGTTFTVPDCGGRFPGFAVFMFFVVAVISKERRECIDCAPVCSFQDLAANQFVFDWRNDPAHAVSIFSRKNRDKYYGLVQKWLSCLCQARPTGATSIAAIQCLVSPLPLLESGKLRWK